MEYQIQNIYFNSLVLFSIINVNVAKTITSFLAFQDICLHINPFVYKYNT